MTAKAEPKKPAPKRARRPRKPAAPRATARKAATSSNQALAGAGAAASTVGRHAATFLSAAGKTTGAWLARALRQPDIQRCISLGLVSGALVLASSAVRAEVDRWPTYRIDRSTLALADLPTDLSPGARRDLERLPLPRDPHAFDHRLVPAVHACLSELSWVQRVEEVRLHSSGALEFSLQARRPVARLGQGVVTADGVVIPASYASEGATLPSLVHVPGAASPVARQEAIDAAVAVLEALSGFDLDVATVDVANLGGKRDPLASEIELETPEGTRIEWGRRPGDERPHLEVDTKRNNLTRFLAEGPALSSCARVSLRWDEVTWVPRPLSSADRVARR